MHAQNQFLSYIREAKNIIQPIDITSDRLDQLETEIQHAELIVPVVGGFSAGKSTLINSFLGTEILPTAITPETALATELRYSTDERIEAINQSGDTIHYTLADLKSIKDNAKNFKLLKLYLNNEQLKQIQPLVLVDMPGFDAPIESHNQAILNYLNRGVYFIFLTSIEDGNITLSMKREIENIQQFGKGFAFCISKTNLRTPEDVQDIQKQIAKQLDEDFDHTDPVVLLDMDGGNNLKQILNAIHPEQLFHALFIEHLKDNDLNIKQSINLKISTLKSSQHDVDDTLQNLQQAVQSLNEQKETALANVEQRYSTQKVDQIVRKVTQAVESRIHSLTDLAMQSPDALTRELNDLIKHHLLIETQRSFRYVSDEILNDFSDHLKAALPQGNLLPEDMVEKIKKTTETLLNKAVSALDHKVQSMKSDQDTQKAMGNIYKVIATIAGITTTVVAPVVEIIIIFLPNIISSLTKGYQERKAKAEIEKNLRTSLIPSIKSELQEKLPAIFKQQTADLIREISEQFEQQLQQKQAEIEQVEQEKAKKAQEIEQMTAQFNDAKQKLEAISKQYLFN
ncbi:MAG: dynamin family protein [Acinetobacter sp.]|nr:dynamin family protein [Acinetobacter sp.]